MRMRHGIGQVISSVRRSATAEQGVYVVLVAAAVTSAIALLDVMFIEAARQSDRVAALLRSEQAVRSTLDRTDPGGPASVTADLTGQRVLSALETTSAAPTGTETRPLASLTGSATFPKVGQGSDARARWYRGQGDTFTTVCVRLCDGWYRPVSFSTTEDKFERDSVACQSSCSEPSRLYVFRNPGGSVEQMEDLSGQAYARLKTAFLFRTSYDNRNCTCRPQPWDQRSAERHRVYALQANAAKGDTAAKRELAALGSKRLAVLTNPAPGAVVEAIERRATATRATARSTTTRSTTSTKSIASAKPPPSPSYRRTAASNQDWRKTVFESIR